MREIEEKVINTLSNPLITGEKNEKPDLILIKGLCSDMDNMVNCTCFRAKEIAQELCKNTKAKAIMCRISLLWIERLENFYQKGFYDDRNHASCKICSYIYKEQQYQQLYNLYSFKKPCHIDQLYQANLFQKADEFKLNAEQIIVLYMSWSHRTLVQTLTRLVFTFLLESGESDISEMFDKMISDAVLQPGFEYLPFI